MQFMPETAKRYGLKDPHDPRGSIDAAAHYLRDLLEKFDGRVDLALAAYNAGEGTVESFRTGKPLVLASGKIINPRRLITGGIPPYPETQSYVKSARELFMNLSPSTGILQSTQARKPSSLFGDSNSDSRQLKKKAFSYSPVAEKKVSTFIEVQ